MKIKIVMVPADRKPYVTNIEDSLKNMQNVVGGYIETVTIRCEAGEAVLVCNEEGRILAMPVNANLPEFVGDVFIAGTDGEEFAGLEDDAARKILRLVREGRLI